MTSHGVRSSNSSFDAVKSPNDKKKYRHLVLENGLQCMLVSAQGIHAKRPRSWRASVTERSMKDLIAARPAGLGSFSEDAAGTPSSTTRPKSISRGRRPLSVSSNNGAHCSHGNTPHLPPIGEVRPLSHSITSDRTHAHRRAGPSTSLGIHDELETGAAPGGASRSSRAGSYVGGKRASYVGSARQPSFVLDPKLASNQIASVSMAVGVGSFNEPDECQGLAHFLEHMLFMGSKKYPQENLFDQFLSQNGGSSNAYTDAERTVYYFSCFQKDLAQALDIFAQFFISPLLLKDAADRELNSIESEFSLRQNVDECRLFEVWRHSSRNKTPFSKFCCGNAKTLKHDTNKQNIDIYEELRKFHNRYYLAPFMRLVIVGYDTLDALEASVADLFAGVRSTISPRSKPTLPPTITEYGAPWRTGKQSVALNLLDEGVWPKMLQPDLKEREDTPQKPGLDGVSLGCLYRISPVSDAHKMTLSWQFPPQHENYRFGGFEYIGHLIGHESKGSILYSLKARGWAIALESTCFAIGGGFEDNSSCSVFSVNVHLTLQGIRDWEHVAGMIFEYIGMLKRGGVQEWVFDESKTISSIQHRFKEEEDYVDFAVDMSVRMLPQCGVEPEWLLDPVSKVAWHPDLIAGLLNQMRPEVTRVDIQSSLFWTNTISSTSDLFPSVDQSSCRSVVEPYTETRYWVARLNPGTLKLWNKVLSGRYTVVFADDSKSARRSVRKSTRKSGTFGIKFGAVVRVDNSSKLVSPLALPIPNPYTPTDFTVKIIREPRRQSVVKDSVTSLIGATIQVQMTKFGAIGGSLSQMKGFNLDASTEANRKSNSAWQLYFETTGATSSTQRNEQGLVVDQKDNLLLISYGLGRFQWHRITSLRGKNGYVLDGTRNARVTPMPKLKSKRGSTTNFAAGRPVRRQSKAARILHALSRRRPEASGDERRKMSDGLTFEERAQVWDNFPEDEIDPLESSLPALVPASDETVMLWFLPDHVNLVPRIECHLRILTPLPSSLPLFAALNDLLGTLLFESLRDKSYLAHLAELELEIDTDEVGISIKVSGFNEKLPKFLDEVIEALVAVAARSERFANGKTPEMMGADAKSSAVFRKHSLSSNKLRSSHRGKPQPQSIRLHHVSDDLKNETKVKVLNVPQSSESSQTNSSSPTSGKRKKETNCGIPGVNELAFHAQLETLTQVYGNDATHFQSEGQLSSVLYKILVNGSWHPEALAEASCNISTAQDVADYAALVLRRCRVEALLCGNITLEDAELVERQIRKRLGQVGTAPLPDAMVPKLNVLQVPISKVNADLSDPWRSVTGLVHPLQALEFEGHSVDLYFQLGPDSLENRLLAEAIEYHMKEPLYSELRTKQQVGYMVQCSTNSVLGMLGFLIEITSNSNAPHELATIVDTFLIDFRETLAALDPLIFHRSACAIARTKIETNKGPKVEAERLWETITLHRYRGASQLEWRSRLDEIDGLRNWISLERLLAAYDRWLLPSSAERRRASVLVYGTTFEGNAVQELGDRKRYITIVGSEYAVPPDEEDLLQRKDGSLQAPGKTSCLVM